MPNPYPQRFADLAAGCTGLMLDNGAGGRLPVSDRCVQLEYVAHPNNDVQGSGLALPFTGDVFDLVLSQAVLEHVPDPQLYIDEVWRVLRPGGLLYVEVAFMQPVHQEPWHYFNVTPYGLAHLLRSWTIVEFGTVGTFGEVIGWLCRAAGVDEVAVPEPAEGRMWWVASGISALARKPLHS